MTCSTRQVAVGLKLLRHQGNSPVSVQGDQQSQQMRAEYHSMGEEVSIENPGLNHEIGAYFGLT
jgi:hypothetical protein